MRKVSTALFVIALALGVFCYWGLFTTAGAKSFDEMDGLIPFFAGVVAAMLGAFAIVLAWIARRP